MAPSKPLEPPGTLGFDQKEAIENIVRLGEADAEAVLERQILEATGNTRIA